MKRPSIQFYPGDWLRDNVSGCSLAAQGLWLRMMLLMHDSERYGYLSVNGKAMATQFIALKTGCQSVEEYLSLLQELDCVCVPSRTSEGIIYSRRMVRDEIERQNNAKRQSVYRERHHDDSNGAVTHEVTPVSHPSSSSSSSSKNQKQWFEELWAKYPNRCGKKQALRHFISSVRDEEVYRRAEAALDNYLKSERVKKGFIQNGSTWFNNWTDWEVAGGNNGGIPSWQR